MNDHDDLDEPCALDYEDAPGYFHPQPQPPAGLTWWQGWWPSYGINSLDDLRLWVETRLDEMISLQSSDSLADIGRLLGVQALKNADRYLGLFGKGDHPPRPSDDKLQRVEDVEDALEAVVRYLRQQSQPAGPSTLPPAQSASTAPVSPPKHRWVQAEADAAIGEFIAQRTHQLAPLRTGAQADQKEAIEKARALVGRNAISRALGVSQGMVSKSPAYKHIAADFHLLRDTPALNKSRAIGLDIAIEDKAVSEDDPVVEEAARREAAGIIRSKLDEEDADLLIGQMECGTISTEKALEYAQVMLDNKDETRTRRKPR